MVEEKNEALLRVHGVAPEHTAEEGVAVGNALLIALGSAGLVLEKELDRFVGIAADYGAETAEIAAWRRFDYAHATLEDQVEVGPRLARHMMYEAIRVVRAAAPPGPSRKITSVSRTLDVAQPVVSMLEAAVTAEDALHRARVSLERAVKRRRGVVSPNVAAGLASIAEQEDDIRSMRVQTMEKG